MTEGQSFSHTLVILNELPNELPNDFESSWADWITTHFPGSADLEVIAPGADPDLDGNNNLAEFFAGILPLVTSPRETIRISGNIAALTLVSREPTTIAAPLEVRWETSGNLATWTDVTADVVLEHESPADAGFVERSYRLNPAGDPDRLLIRRLLVAPQSLSE